MRTSSLLALALATQTVLVMVGAWLKITHTAGAESFLMLGLAGCLLCLLLFARFVYTAGYLTRVEKSLWLAGFLFFGFFAALLYLIKYRRLLS